MRAAGSGVGVYADGWLQGGSDSAVILEAEDDDTVAGRVERATRSVLGGVQDCVCEYLTEPWPVGPDGGLAFPDCRVDGEWVRLWYGEECEPVVVLQSIRLRELVPAV